jgi:[protein-PII] uridylyltransferase
VTDLTGHKIDSKARQNRIRDALLAVFEPSPHDLKQAQRAAANG